jgi:SAM-dependent methyltransferase
MASGRLDTRAVGLDAGLGFIRWLTGAENLHYGLWEGLEPTAGNLRAAQEAYTTLLFSYLPQRTLRILDVGGGAGETAKRLLAMGHSVEIVVPSPAMAARCRENAPAATVHECRFEDLRTEGGRFDLCLFSESFQYIRLDRGLAGALALLDQGGEILIADCFRTPAYRDASREGAVVGGGHLLQRFERELAMHPLMVLARRDITDGVAPSIDVEQGFFNVIGNAIRQIDGELSAKRPRLRWLLRRTLPLVASRRRRERLARRLFERERTAEAFCRFNRYLIMRIARASQRDLSRK